MEISLISVLFTLNYLQFFWIIGYKIFFSFRQVLCFTIYLFFQVFINIVLGKEVFLNLLIPLVIIESVFIINFLKNWSLAVFYSLLQNTMIIFSWLVTWDLVYFLRISNTIAYSQVIFLKPIAMLLQQVVLFIVLLIIKKVNKKHIILKYVFEIKKKYIFQSLFCYVSLLVLNIIWQISIIKFKITIFFYLTFILFAFLVCFYYIVYLIKQYYEQKQQISVMSKHFSQQSEQIILANEFRHDYRNILFSLVTYLEENKYNQARNYLTSIIEYSNSLTEEDFYPSVSLITVSPVQGIIIKFLEECKSERIPVELMVHQNILYQDITINLVDFIRCVSILFDNALEASLEIEDPFIKVKIEKKNGSLFFEIKNRFNTDILIENMCKNNFTTKNNHQGKGIRIFMKLLKQYQATSYSFSREKDLLVVRFYLSENR